MKYSEMLLAVTLLAAGGCARDYFGPMAVPLEYTAVQIASTRPEEARERLQELQELPPVEYRISPQDRFNISVYEHPELEVKNTMVAPDGLVSMPLIGAVKVGGLTFDEAHKTIADKLSRFLKSPKVSLIPIEMAGFSYTITGLVNHPGRFPISLGHTRLVDAVADAKGFQMGLHAGTTVPLADLDNAYISRDGELLPVDFNEAIIRGSKLHNIPLLNGDYIYIPAAMNTRVAILGEVNTQTYIGFTDGQTLLNTLTYAGGLRDTHSSHIKIIRGGLKNPTVYTINVDKMLLGQIQDFPLRPDDIIYVPKDGMSDWNVIVRKVLPTMQGLSMLAGPFGNPSSLYAGD